MAQIDISDRFSLVDVYDTAPPAVARQTLKRQLGEMASSLIMPLIRHAARPYLGGESIDDALFVADRLQNEGFSTAFSYWDGGQESQCEIEAIAHATITTLATAAPQSYLALKPPALRFCEEAARRLAQTAAQQGVRLHFDSHGTGVTNRQNAMINAMLTVTQPRLLGTTLPGRHPRSLRDADWAAETGLNVRVVKGEWPDESDPKYDPRDGFLAVIDRLAGRAHHVAVATHELALAHQAILRLRNAGTACGLEVLLGMAAEPLLAWAKAESVPVRVYVPYGCGFIPNAMGVLRRNPRLALSVARAQMQRITMGFR